MQCNTFCTTTFFDEHHLYLLSKVMYKCDFLSTFGNLKSFFSNRFSSMVFGQYYIGDSPVLVYLLQVESTITPPEPLTPSTRQRPTPQTLPGQWDTPPPQVCLVSLPFVQQQDFFNLYLMDSEQIKSWM